MVDPITDPAAQTAVPSTTGVAPANSNTGAAPAAGGTNSGKSPLDVLEELLKQKQAEAAQKGGAPASSSAPSAAKPGAAPTDVSAPADPATVPAAAAAQQAEIQALQEAKRLEDEAAIQAQLQALQSVTQMPENQARLEQQQTAQYQAETQAAEQQGFEIHQVTHTKM